MTDKSCRRLLTNYHCFCAVLHLCTSRVCDLTVRPQHTQQMLQHYGTAPKEQFRWSITQLRRQARIRAFWGWRDRWPAGMAKDSHMLTSAHSKTAAQLLGRGVHRRRRDKRAAYRSLLSGRGQSRWHCIFFGHDDGYRLFRQHDQRDMQLGPKPTNFPLLPPCFLPPPP